MNNGILHVRKVQLLYKTILKLHRGLPEPLQSLGDQYVKDEFKRHKNCNSKEAAQFMMEWTHYAVMLANQMGLQEPKSTLEVGTELSQKTLELMREDQVVQLYEMLQAARGIKTTET